MAVSFKGVHFPQEIILTCVRWYVAYPLSMRHVEELMRERGVPVDHATVNRWVVKYSPQLEETFHRRKRPVGVSWRVDETYINVKGEWRYLYRAVDKMGQTIDFLLTEQRDEQAATHFLTKAIRRHGVPEKITIDGSEANEAAIKRYNKEHGTAIAIRQVKYLNNVGEQDHRGVKRVTRSKLGFKSFRQPRAHWSASSSCTCLRRGKWSSRRGRESHTGCTVLRPGRLILSPAGLSRSSLKICDRSPLQHRVRIDRKHPGHGPNAQPFRQGGHRPHKPLGGRIYRRERAITPHFLSLMVRKDVRASSQMFAVA
jgi:transposase-like protein